MISGRAEDLVERRDRWLTRQRLDDAVLDAYSWPHELTDDQILERLLALNLKRAVEKGDR